MGQAISVIDHDLLFAACSSERCICKIKLGKDGFGIHDDVEIFHMYIDEWKNVASMAVYQSSLYIAHRNAGIEEISLSTYQSKRVINRVAYYSSPSTKITA